jgi:hypothetical protein
VVGLAGPDGRASGITRLLTRAAGAGRHVDCSRVSFRAIIITGAVDGERSLPLVGETVSHSSRAFTASDDGGRE